MIEKSNNDDVLLAILANDVVNNPSLAEVIAVTHSFFGLFNKEIDAK